MEMITQAFQQTFTLQWALLAIPISFVLSILANRVMAAGVFAFFAMAIQHVGPVVWPLFMQNASREAMMAAATQAVQKLDPIGAVMELIAFTFFISVFSLTRQDMFRIKPTT